MTEAQLTQLRESARQGDVNAQYRLAMLHIYGDGVAEDNVLAAELLQKAAEQGHAEAQYNLGICLHYGYGVSENHTLAFEWYRKSAEQGYAKGMILVGKFYLDGLAVQPDACEAVRWFSAAAEQNAPDTQGYEFYLLGHCFENGLGTEKNPVKAEEYYRIAQSRGYKPAT